VDEVIPRCRLTVIVLAAVTAISVLAMIVLLALRH